MTLWFALSVRVLLLFGLVSKNTDPWATQGPGFMLMSNVHQGFSLLPFLRSSEDLPPFLKSSEDLRSPFL